MVILPHSERSQYVLLYFAVLLGDNGNTSGSVYCQCVAPHSDSCIWYPAVFLKDGVHRNWAKSQKIGGRRLV